MQNLGITHLEHQLKYQLDPTRLILHLHQEPRLHPTVFHQKQKHLFPQLILPCRLIHHYHRHYQYCLLNNLYPNLTIQKDYLGMHLQYPIMQMEDLNKFLLLLNLGPRKSFLDILLLGQDIHHYLYHSLKDLHYIQVDYLLFHLHQHQPIVLIHLGIGLLNRQNHHYLYHKYMIYRYPFQDLYRHLLKKHLQKYCRLGHHHLNQPIVNKYQ